MKRLTLVFIISTYLCVSIVSALQESLTYDEPVHLNVGMDAWKTQTFVADPFSPPLIGELSAIPSLLGSTSLIKSSVPSYQAFPARMVILFISTCLLVVLYITVKKWIGEKEALVAVFFMAWDPMILAHNHLVTKDMGFAFFFFLTYTLYVYLLQRFSWKVFLSWVLLFGCMLASKTSALPFFVVSITALYLLDPAKRVSIRKLGWKTIGGIFCALFIVWATYFFQTDVIIAKRDDSNRISARLEQYAEKTQNTVVKNALWIGTQMRLPLGTYIASLKNGILLQRDTGITVFLGKEYKRVQWYFLPVHLFYKTPIPILIFLLFFIFLLWKKTVTLSKFAIFLAPILGIIFFLCMSGVKPFVRYLLPIYPFIYIFSSTAFVHMVKRKYLCVPILLCAWYTLGTVLHFPHPITFANEFAGSDRTTITKLVDSDIDWGQGLFDMYTYAKKHDLANFRFSYFGTDNGNLYGLMSTTTYGTYKADEICAFHVIGDRTIQNKVVTFISVSNWYYCGYYKQDQYKKDAITGVIGSSILIFSSR
jgi:hypothetical protein